MQIARNVLMAEPLLTAAEEVDLAYQMEAGLLAGEARGTTRRRVDATDAELLLLQEQGELARQRYIRANLRLVAMVAGQAAARSQLPEGDLFQEGCLGLIHAVERFDCRRGVRFSTYALFWVKAYVGEATANLLGGLNLPGSRAAQLRTLHGVEAELAQSLGRQASVAELAVAMGRSEAWTVDLMAAQVTQSLDGLTFEGMNVDGLNALGPASGGNAFESVLAADRPGAELLWHLTGLDRDVLARRFGFHDGTVHTYAAIARTLDLSVSRVRRLEQRALETLRSVCPQSASVHL